MTPLLLHACCAPCAAPVVEWLLAQKCRPVLFYYNPNIAPPEEYERRKAECIRFARLQGLVLIAADYDHDEWLRAVAGLEDEPERGQRCLRCFQLRLLAAARYARRRGFERFASTLGASRWKSLEQIADAGQWAAEQAGGSTTFWAKNWRADGLALRRSALIKAYNFYNQTYCGCPFSQRRP